MPVKRKKKKFSAKRMQRGAVGSFFVFIVLVILIIAGISAVGGLPSQIGPSSGQTVAVVTPSTSGGSHNNLQLKTFGYITLAPTPTLAAPPPDTPGQPPLGQTALCQSGGINEEPDIIAATSPTSGQSVSSTGQIKIWVMDEGAPMIAPGETVNSNGSISNPGNQSQKAPDNYLYEPAVYLDAATAESGGSPHFPNYIKGQVNNMPSTPIMTTNLPAVVATDPLPSGAVTTGCFAGSNFFKCYTAEYIWNISSLGLSSGTHRAEFVIHDGDSNRGIGCVNISIQ